MQIILYGYILSPENTDKPFSAYGIQDSINFLLKRGESFEQSSPDTADFYLYRRGGLHRRIGVP